MSGDLRAKKSTRIAKSGGNKKERSKKTSKIQYSDSYDEFEDSLGVKDSSKSGECLTRKEYNTEEDDEDTIVTTKVLIEMQ